MLPSSPFATEKPLQYSCQDAIVHPIFLRYVQVIGVALMVASVLYLMAANWFMLPGVVKLAIPMVLMLVFGFGSMCYTGVAKDTLETVSAMMIGLGLAVIGQVYQTGADSMWLFVLWGMLALPWCYRHNVGVFVLVCVVWQIALRLGFLQIGMLGRLGSMSTLLVFGLMVLVQYVLARRYYPLMIYAFVLELGVLAVLTAMLDKSQSSLLTPLCVVGLPVLAMLGNKHKRPLVFSLALVSLSLGVFVWVVADERFGFLTHALLAMVWFGATGYLLLRLLPLHRFYTIPLALGGWFAGVCLSLFVLLDFYGLALGFGMVLLTFGALVLFFVHHVFLRHFGYCVFAVGQVVFFVGLADGMEQPFGLLFGLQLLFLGLLSYLRVHWFYELLQLFGCYGLLFCWVALGALGEQYPFTQVISSELLYRQALLFAVALSPLALLFWRRSGVDRLAPTYLRSLAFFVVGALAFWQVLATFGGASLHSWTFFGAAVPILAWVLYQFAQSARLRSQSLWAFVALMVVLGIFGQVNVFVALLLLAYAVCRDDKLLLSVVILLIGFLLWQAYYLMTLTFLVKFASMWLSGLVVLVFGAWVQTTQKGAWS